MKQRLASLSTLAALLAACGGSSSRSAAPAAAHDYNGTASVGDFVTAAIDHAANIIQWANHTNGESGSAPFTVAFDGALVVSTETGQIKKAYEIPGYAVVAYDPSAGPDHDRPSPVFLWEKTAATTNDFKAMPANMIQFRNSGAFEIGCGSIAANGASIDRSGYEPESFLWNSTPFVVGETLPILTAPPANPTTFDGVVLRDRTDGTIEFQAYKTSQGGPDGNPGVLFRAGSSWVIDVDNGSVFILDAPTTKAWQPSNAGTYHLMGWDAAGVTSNSAGTGTFVETTIALDAAGSMTVADPHGGSSQVVTLVPFADDTDVAGAGKVDLACNGLFTNGPGHATDKVVVGFVGRTLFFGLYKQMAPGPTVEFLYGVGIKQ